MEESTHGGEIFVAHSHRERRAIVMLSSAMADASQSCQKMHRLRIRSAGAHRQIMLLHHVLCALNGEHRYLAAAATGGFCVGLEEGLHGGKNVCG